MSIQSQTTVLLVDDQPDNVGVMFGFLKAQGLRLLIALDGPSALERARLGNPDLILLDVLMPGMDGFEVCRRLKADPATRDTPIIFMTGLSETSDKVKGLSLGASDYITKPIQKEEVLARVSTHLRLSRLQRELKARNDDLDAFSRMVAHDLKTPLATISGHAQVMLRQARKGSLTQDRLIAQLHAMERAGRRMAETTDALLMLARAAHEDAPRQPVPMAPLVAAILDEDLAEAIRAAEATVHIEGALPEVLGHAPWLRQVWLNLLTNGLKYGGPCPTLTIRTSTPERGLCRFEVRDAGPGLAEADHGAIFEPFVRLHADGAQGHGLGLTIVARIVHRLGGQVGVESEPGRGAAFFFTLPLADDPHR